MDKSKIDIMNCILRIQFLYKIINFICIFYFCFMIFHYLVLINIFTGCSWQGKPCQLIVNHEEGFMLFASGTRAGGINGVSPASPPAPLWKRSFDKLRMSADDGARLLWLDFGDDDPEIVSTLETIKK